MFIPTEEILQKPPALTYLQFDRSGRDLLGPLSGSDMERLRRTGQYRECEQR